MIDSLWNINYMLMNISKNNNTKLRHEILRSYAVFHKSRCNPFFHYNGLSSLKRDIKHAICKSEKLRSKWKSRVWKQTEKANWILKYIFTVKMLLDSFCAVHKSFYRNLLKFSIKIENFLDFACKLLKPLRGLINFCTNYSRLILLYSASKICKNSLYYVSVDRFLECFFKNEFIFFFVL